MAVCCWRLNFVLLTVMSDNTEMAVRISLLSAGIWWAVFTIIPVRGIRSRPPVNPVAESGGLVQASFGQLWRTLKDLRAYPVTLTFLLAYLFYNDGIQTVIYAASIYGEKELGFEKSTVLMAFLVVQFVGIVGALGFGRLASRVGAFRVIMAGLFVWLVVVVVGWLIPNNNFPLFLVLAVGDRRRAGRHPGAVPLLLQPADPPWPRSGVLRALPGRASVARAGSAP